MRSQGEDIERDRRPLLRVIGAGALACAALGALGCSKPLQPNECKALLDRYVELLVHADHPDAGGDEIVRLQAEARTEAAGDPAFARCSNEVSRSQYECAMQATNPDQLEQCLM